MQNNVDGPQRVTATVVANSVFRQATVHSFPVSFWPLLVLKGIVLLWRDTWSYRLILNVVNIPMYSLWCFSMYSVSIHFTMCCSGEKYCCIADTLLLFLLFSKAFVSALLRSPLLVGHVSKQFFKIVCLLSKSRSENGWLLQGQW